MASSVEWQFPWLKFSQRGGAEVVPVVTSWGVVAINQELIETPGEPLVRESALKVFTGRIVRS